MTPFVKTELYSIFKAKYAIWQMVPFVIEHYIVCNHFG